MRKWILTKTPMQADLPTGRCHYLIEDEEGERIINAYDDGDAETEKKWKLMASAPATLEALKELFNVDSLDHTAFYKAEQNANIVILKSTGKI